MLTWFAMTQFFLPSGCSTNPNSVLSSFLNATSSPGCRATPEAVLGLSLLTAANLHMQQQQHSHISNSGGSSAVRQVALLLTTQ